MISYYIHTHGVAASSGYDFKSECFWNIWTPYSLFLGPAAISKTYLRKTTHNWDLIKLSKMQGLLCQFYSHILCKYFDLTSHIQHRSPDIPHCLHRSLPQP